MLSKAAHVGDNARKKDKEGKAVKDGSMLEG